MTFPHAYRAGDAAMQWGEWILPKDPVCGGGGGGGAQEVA